MKILVFNAAPVYPVHGMSTVRIINQIKALSNDHEVDLMYLHKSSTSGSETISKLSSFCREIIPIKAFSQTVFFRVLRKLFLKKLFRVINYPGDFFSSSNILTAKKIAAVINKSDYDIIISHYWQASGFLRYVMGNTKKFIDTHYLVEENVELWEQGHYNHLNDHKLGNLLQKELQLQNEMFSKADGFIVNSIIQKEILDKKFPADKSLCIPNGQDLEPFFETPIHESDKELNLLFYGALSNQFNSKAIQRILNHILPAVRKQKPDIKLIIMGSGPPKWLLDSTKDDPAIEITGFVHDVRKVFARSFACVIPLDSGSGFRGRTVELMASGVPLIGTNNALKSVEIEHGINGLIAESNEDMASYIVQLAEDKTLRLTIAQNAALLAKNKYTLQATFGLLSKKLIN